MSSPRPTLKDVARHAGVARTTASDALAGNGRVSAETRMRVRQAADELGYTLNVEASRLRRRGLPPIGIHIPREVAEVSFHMRFTLGAAAAARAAGVDLTLLALDDGDTAAHPPPGGGVLIVEALRGDPVVAHLLGLGLPVVLAGRHLDMPDAGIVIAVDHYRMMTAALDHLVAAGARRPGLLAPRDNFKSDWAEQILRAYGDWCRARGIKPAIRPVSASPNATEIDQAVRELVSMEAIDGLIGSHEGSAARALPALQRLGINPGPRFPVLAGVGCDTDAHTIPPLTVIELHPFDFGSAAASRLIDCARDDEAAKSPIVRPAELIIRESTVGVMPPNSSIKKANYATRSGQDGP